MIPLISGTNKVSAMTASAYSLDKVSFINQRKETQTGDLELKRQICKFGEIKAAGICREEYRGKESCMEKRELHRQRALETCRRFLSTLNHWGGQRK